jgi:hypothetical protein
VTWPMIENTGPGGKSKASTKFIVKDSKVTWWVGLSERAKPKSS